MVVNYYRDKAAADEVAEAAEKIGVKALLVRADVSKVDEINRLFDETVSAFGKVDIVVANAGIEKVNIPVVDVKEEDFDLLFCVNTKGPYFVMQAAARHISDGGRIVNIASSSTSRPQPGLYGMSKTAPKYLVRVLVLELGSRQVTVNSLVPGPIDGSGIFTGVGDTDPHKKSRLGTIPIGHMATAEDVADFVEFLASEQALFITAKRSS